MTGYGLWRRLFGQSRNILGPTILVNRNEFQIVGVTPRSFFGVEIGNVPEIFMPFEAERTYKDYQLFYRHGPAIPSLDDRGGTIVPPILAGGDFTASDSSTSFPVAILSEDLAKVLFGGVHPVGLRFRESDTRSNGEQYTVEVVGIAKSHAISQTRFRAPPDLVPAGFTMR